VSEAPRSRLWGGGEARGAGAEATNQQIADLLKKIEVIWEKDLRLLDKARGRGVLTDAEFEQTLREKRGGRKGDIIDLGRVRPKNQ
jgi:hypothetical protein